MGPQNHVLNGGPDLPCEGAIFRGKDMPGHAGRHSAVSCPKMAEPIEMSFGLCSGGSLEACVAWRHIGAIWRIRLYRPHAAAMRPYVKLLLLRIKNMMLSIKRYRSSLQCLSVNSVDDNVEICIVVDFTGCDIVSCLIWDVK